MPYIIGGAILLVLILWLVSTYNTLVKQRLNCEEAFSTMDVYLKKRFDLIPNLVNTVKGYAKHEAETLEKVIAMRNQAGSKQAVAESEAAISGTIRNIVALSESYPDLKANENFRDLTAQLTSIENDIAQSRKYYNAVVKRYNEKIMTLPSNIVASMFRFEKEVMFTVDSEQERKNVRVEF